jgi:hypothetical protein
MGRYMKFGKYISLFVILLIISGCKKPEDILPPAKNIVLLKKQDHLSFHNNKQKIYSEITNIISYQDDKLIILLGKEREIYITDSDLKIIDSITFKDRDFYFDNKPILSAALKEDSLYLIQNGYYFNVLNLRTKELTKRKLNMSKVPVLIDHIVFTGNNTFAASVNNISKWSMAKINSILPDPDKLTFGLKYLLDGGAISIYSLSKKIFDYDKFESDNSFVSRTNNYVIYSFNISKKVFVFDLEDNLKSHFVLKVDEKYWKAPEWKFENGRKVYRFTSLMFKPLQTKGDYIYQLMIHNEGDESTNILKYDIYGKVLERYTLPELKHMYLYNVSVINNRIYVYSSFSPDIYIYEGIE